MPFLGTTPTQGFVGANPKQSFTANGSTTVFTLTHPVASKRPSLVNRFATTVTPAGVISGKPAIFKDCRKIL